MACAHAGCHCAETPVKRGARQFCSEKCAGAEASSSSACPCGHPGCRGTAGTQGGRTQARGAAPIVNVSDIRNVKRGP